MAARVRKFNVATGTVNVLIKDTGISGTPNFAGLDVSSNGTVYIADRNTHVVYKVFEDGRLLGTVAGHIGSSGDTLVDPINGDDGNDARFNVPVCCAVDASDNILIVDRNNKRIKKMNAHGKVQSLAGSGGTGDAISDTGSLATFSATLTGVCVDKAGIVYVADTGNHKVKKIMPSGKVNVIAGGPGGAGATGMVNGNGNTARFASPEDVCVDAQGNIYVADTGNNRIRKITPNGEVSTLAGNGTGSTVDGQGVSATFNSPKRIAISPDGNTLFVLDNNGAIRRVTLAGKVTSFTTYGVFTPTYRSDLCVDKSGFLYVLENY